MFWITSKLVKLVSYLAVFTVQQYCGLQREEQFYSLSSATELNDSPIIGVLAQDYYGKLNHGTSYIAASYVKYLESAGARVVPIFINQTVDYYAKIVNFTNGLFFPGGNNHFNRSDSGYGVAGKILYKLAVQANDRGQYYPVWGSCLGFELLTYLSSNYKWWLTQCSAQDLPLPLRFEPGIQESRLMMSMPKDVQTYLAELPVTINYHSQCFTPENWAKSGLDLFYQVLSTNTDNKNQTFISTMEAYSYPFYGTAWHPEKNQFEFIMKKNRKLTPHSYQAVRIGQHFANFFVNEARLSQHHFPSQAEESQALIYNYQPVYTSPTGSSFEQCYFFN